MDQGGAERVLASLASTRDGAFDHHIVSLLAGAPFFPVAPARFDTLGLTRNAMSLRPFLDVRAYATRVQPSVIHAWLYHGNLVSTAAAGLGIPIVWSIHNTTFSTEHSKRTTRVINRVCAVLSHAVPTRIVYCAPSARALHEKIGYAPRRGLVIENGIDMVPFRFDPATRQRMRAALDIADGEFAVGCVARFDPQKNQRLVIDAFARVAATGAAKLVLVGTGCTPDNAELGAWLSRFGVADRAILLGRRDDVAALMAALDVLVIGSSYGEALPMVAIEAAASGLPVVATDVGDVAPFVRAPSHVVPIENPERMAAALLDVREHRFGAHAAQPRTWVKSDVAEYSLERMRARYEDLYRAVARR